MASITDNVTKVNFVNGSTTTELNLVKVNLNGTIYYKYVKAFTYTAGSKTGVSTITCTRASSPYAGAATGTVASGGTIYYGDTIYFTATAVSGYTVTSSVTVDNPMTVSSNVTGVNYITVTPNNYSLTITEFATGVNYIHVKIGSGSYTQYSDQGTFTISVPFNSTVYIYDTVASGYTAKYTQSVPFVFTMGTSGYTYSPVPATSTLTLTKNTGVASIYYKVNGATSWTQTTTSTTVSVNYNTTVYWYAPGETGYSRNDSYTSSSSYATISNFKVSQTVSPTATRLKYSFTVTLSDYVTEFKYSTDNTNWTASTATKTFSNVDYATTYYIKPTAYGVTDAQYTYTWVQGSTATSTLTYSSHANITYKQSRTINKYAVTITGGTGISAVYLSTNSSATSGDASGTTYNYNTTVYGFVTLSNNTAQYTYTPQSSWALVSGRTYRVGSVTTTTAKSFGTLNAIRTTNAYAVNFSLGNYVTNAFTSTSSTATSGSASGTTYDYGTVVYYFVTKYANSTEYTYTCSGTQISGNIYRLGSVTVDGTENLGALSGVTRTPNNFTLTINLPEVGVAETWYKVGSGSYTKVTYGSEAFTTSVAYGTSVSIYDVPVDGYNVQYTSSSPLTFSMGTSGYTYSPRPTTSTFTMMLNTGVASIYYKINGASTWSQATASKTTVQPNYGSTIYWYAPAATGYSRDDSYVDSSHYATISNVKTSKTISPTATRLTYSFTVTLSDYVTEFSYSTNNINWTASGASRTFSNVDYGTTYYIKPTAYGVTNAQYTYTWVSGSATTTTVTYSSHANITYKQSRTLNKYAVTISAGTGVSAVYLSTSSTATSGSASGTTYDYNTTVYGFATLANNTAQYTYTAPSGWTLVSGRTYRVGSVATTSAQNFGTMNATRTTNKYAVNFTLGNYVTNAFLSTSSSATSGSASGTTYDYGTTVYYFVTKYENSTEYTYTCSGTQVSGNVYRLGSVTVNGTKNLGALSSVTRTPNNFNLIVNMGSTGVTAVYVKIGTGSYVRYPNPDEALFISVPYDTTFEIYDEVAAGYTARYTESVPFVYTMTTAGYTYNTSPATWSISFVKNTGVSAIYYREINSSNWTSITSSQTVSFTYSASSRVYWYAPAATGYTRDDSYVDSSHYATVYNPTTVSPTATINTYAVTFTAGSYVTKAFTSTNANATSGNASGTKYNYGTTVYYFVEKYADTDIYEYTCSGTLVSGNVYRLGSVVVNSAKNLGTLSSVTRTTKKITYTIKVAALTTDLVAPYYICSDSNDYDELVSQGGLGWALLKEFTVTVERAVNLTEVYLSQALVQQQLPGSYVYTGGTITFTGDHRANPYLYVGVYVYDDDH